MLSSCEAITFSSPGTPTRFSGALKVGWKNHLLFRHQRHKIQKKTAFFLHLKTIFGLVDDTKLVIWTEVLPSLYDLLAAVQ